MGMTIDEALKHLNTYSSTMGSGQTTQEQHEESKRVAIDTMRKYQKIVEIVGNYGFDTSWLCLKKIGKVIEDGNDR